ncbi:MAG: alpha-L-fucosidase [Abditibacteriota bacterium]|nr:alpha-L-fucosidase [Abditibacteriota bacterium]
MYQRASIKQLGGGYGLGFHWTTWNVDQNGVDIPFEEQVNNFDLNFFINQAKELGASHVLVTNCHQYQFPAGPNPYIDKLIPNRTCKRDLMGELSEALAKEGIKFIMYYHHGCDGAHQDPDWWKACGAGDFYSDTFYKNYIDIVSYFGERYGKKIDAYWFDAGYGLFRRGVVPWEALSKAAKVGNPDRLITYNPGVRSWGLYTPYQDYYSGETHYFDDLPVGEKTNTGLDWYAFMALHKWVEDPDNPDCAQWGIDGTCYDKQDWDISDSKKMAEFVKAYNAIGSTVTFNMLCYADGSIHPVDVKAIQEMRKYL